MFAYIFYIGIFLIFYFYILLRNRSYDERYFAVVALAASAFFNYFSVSDLELIKK